jgi:tetratricopeptide (TPR) repeat protein
MWAIAAFLLFFQGANPGEAGVQALQEKRYADAAQALERAIAAEPADYTLRYYLGLAYGALGRDGDAVAAYRKALELHPGLYEAQLNAAVVLLRMHDAGAALPLAEEASRAKPAEFLPALCLAEALLDSAVYDRAETEFRRALQLDGGAADAALGLARALARQDKLAESEPFYRQAVALNPASRPALYELATLYDRAGNRSGALALYLELPDNAGAAQRSAQLLLESKRYQEAVARFETGYSKNPTPAAAGQLALAYTAAGDSASARPLFEKALASLPSDFQLRSAYARLLRDGREFPAAARQFELAARLRPEDAQTWTDLGVALHLAGDLRAALAAFERAQALGNSNRALWFFRATILDKLHEIQPAAAAYRRYLEGATGESANQEFQARQRLKLLEREARR